MRTPIDEKTKTFPREYNGKFAENDIYIDCQHISQMPLQYMFHILNQQRIRDMFLICLFYAYNKRMINIIQRTHLYKNKLIK